MEASSLNRKMRNASGASQGVSANLAVYTAGKSYSVSTLAQSSPRPFFRLVLEYVETPNKARHRQGSLTLLPTSFQIANDDTWKKHRCQDGGR